jgi:hypothetical protein
VEVNCRINVQKKQTDYRKCKKRGRKWKKKKKLKINTSDTVENLFDIVIT